MRTIIFAALATLGLSTASASAAPVNGSIIGGLASAPVTTVQYYGGYGYGYGYRSYGGYGYRSYGYRRYGY